MTVIPYSSTERYTDTIHADDVFVIEEHGSGFSGMKKITVGDFLQPVYDRIASVLSSMYKYMGAVETFEDLPEYSEPQDPIPVYGILTGSHAGENWAFVTDHWEKFALEMDLSDYVTEEQLLAALENYAPTVHQHTQSQIKDLDVIESFTLVSGSSESGGSNVFSVQTTKGTSKQFAIKNGEAGSSAVAYRIIGLGSVTRNLDGSADPPYLYIQSQKLTEEISAYEGRILVASKSGDDWITVYPAYPAAWSDEAFLQFYIPAAATALRVRLYPRGTDYSDITDDKILYEEHVSIAQAGPRGYDSKSVSIEADSYVFRADKAGTIQEPQTITFIARLQNTVDVPLWSAVSDGTLVKSGTGEAFTINKIEMASYTSLQVSVVCDGIIDRCSVVKVSDGADGDSSVSIACKNEAFSIPVDENKITRGAFSTEVEFLGYTGTVQTQCYIQSVTGVPSGMSYSIDGAKITFTVPVSTVFSSVFGSIEVELSCGSAVFSKTVSWSLSVQGVAAKLISIESDSYVFKTDSSGTIQEPSQIVFTADTQNLTSTVRWSATNGETIVKTGSGSSFTLTSTDMGQYKYMKIQATCEGYSDTCTVVAVSDGSSGWSTSQIRLLKRSDQIPPAYDGDTATYTFATNTLSFGQGGSDGWSVEIPSGTDPLYVIYASAHSQSAVDEIQPNEWTTPVVLSEEAVQGQNGYNVATVLIYKRSSVQPEPPALDVSYLFAGGMIEGLTGGWTKSIPTGVEDLWVTQATAFSRTESDTISSDEWAVPSIMSSNGKAYNNAYLTLYKKSYETPSAYAGGIAVYDFTTSAYSFGQGGSDGWSKDIPQSNGDLYIICCSVSSQDSQVSVLPNQWTTPQLYLPEPSNGEDGYSAAAVMIYARSASAPRLPQTDLTYVFTTGEVINLPSPWTNTPVSGDEDLWVAHTVAFSQDISYIIPHATWSSPVVISSNGQAGSNGYSSAQVVLYKRSTVRPGVFAGSTATYTFSTGKLVFSGSDDGWSQLPPDGSDDLYSIRAVAASQTETDLIAVSEWSEPALYSAKAAAGENGLNGYNVAVVHIYKRAYSTPSTPSEDSVYVFETGRLTGLSDGWSDAVPNGEGLLWTTQATAFSRSTTDIIESTQWAVPPTVMAKDGEDGIDGINIVCTNESFSIPTDHEGVTVQVFTTEASFTGYVGTTAKTATVIGVSDVPEGMEISYGSNTLQVTVFQNTDLEGDYGSFIVTVSCENGNFAKSIFWSKAKQGQTGSKGETGNTWYQGTALTGKTTCTGAAGNVGDSYLNNSTCDVYECITKGDEITAVWQYKMNIKGDKGESFSINITSTNGSVFRINDVNTTLSCHVYVNTTEITDALNAYRFRWKRISSDPVDDERWNSLGKAIAHKSVDITPADCIGRTVFSCEVDLSDFE